MAGGNRAEKSLDIVFVCYMCGGNTAECFVILIEGLMAGIGSSVIASVALAKGKIKAARLNVTQSLLFVTALVAAAFYLYERKVSGMRMHMAGPAAA